MDIGKFFGGLSKAPDESKYTETIKQLLLWDDRDLRRGLAKEKERGIITTILRWLFIDEDTEYTNEDLKYREWIMSQLFDSDVFVESFPFTYPLVSHTTRYLEWQYRRYYKSNPKKHWLAMKQRV